MSLSDAQRRGVRVGLGSDVGAGRSFSMRRACARAYDASRITQSPTTPSELFWLASRGGALALRRPDLGVIERGAHADVICLEPQPRGPHTTSMQADVGDHTELTSAELDKLIAG